GVGNSSSEHAVGGVGEKVGTGVGRALTSRASARASAHETGRARLGLLPHQATVDERAGVDRGSSRAALGRSSGRASLVHSRTQGRTLARCPSVGARAYLRRWAPNVGDEITAARRRVGGAGDDPRAAAIAEASFLSAQRFRDALARGGRRRALAARV